MPSSKLNLGDQFLSQALKWPWKESILFPNDQIDKYMYTTHFFMWEKPAMELCHCEKEFDASQISFVYISAVEFYLAWKKAENVSVLTIIIDTCAFCSSSILSHIGRIHSSNLQ